MTDNERISELLTANNALVEKNRLLRNYVRKARDQFVYYENKHEAKAARLMASENRDPDTEQAYADTRHKAAVNRALADEGSQVLAKTNPS